MQKGDKKNILLVEDDKLLLDGLILNFEYAGFTIQVAETVEEAVELVEKNTIDFIWLDHYLIGGKTGLDFLKWLREGEKHSSIPVYVVSQTSSEGVKDSYIQLGVEKFYTKLDVKMKEVVSEVKELLG